MRSRSTYGATLIYYSLRQGPRRKDKFLQVGRALRWPAIAFDGQPIIPEGRNAWETFVQTADVNTLKLAIAALRAVWTADDAILEKVAEGRVYLLRRQKGASGEFGAWLRRVWSTHPDVNAAVVMIDTACK